MQAETLNCPMCGAPSSSDATRCEHCGARLATVACPSCFGMIFHGAKFCSHCGAKIGRMEVPETARLLCPRCRVGLEAVVIGTTNLRECPHCEGLWADPDTLQEICVDREKQAAVLGIPRTITPDESRNWEDVRYLPCPVCRQFMNRIQFAHCSHVIVDVCGKHGTWFDRDELRRIVEFIRAGGMEKSRAEQIEEFERKRSEATAVSIGSAASAPDISPSWSRSEQHLGISLVGSLLKFFFDK